MDFAAAVRVADLARAEADRARALFAFNPELLVEERLALMAEFFDDVRFDFTTELFEDERFAFADALLLDLLFEARDDADLRDAVTHFTRLRLLPRAPRDRLAFVQRTGCGFGRVHPTS